MGLYIIRGRSEKVTAKQKHLCWLHVSCDRVITPKSSVLSCCINCYWRGENGLDWAWLACRSQLVQIPACFHSRSQLLRGMSANKKIPWPLVRKRTIPTERSPLAGEVSANFCNNICKTFKTILAWYTRGYFLQYASFISRSHSTWKNL
jgi:hypothetical protein